MRKFMLLLVLASFTGMVNAQAKKKKAPAAKEAAAKAKADADAKAKAAQDAANAKLNSAQDSAKNKAADLEKSAADKLASMTATDETKINISAWGGYNITGKSTYVKNVETLFDTYAAATKSNDTTMGGIAGGADFFYGSGFQFGLNVAYMKGHSVTRTLVEAPNTYVIKSTMDYAPILVSARYFVIPGLYVGGGVGVASVLNGAESLKKDGVTQTIDLAPKGTAGSVNWDFTYSGTAIAVQGRLGYDFAISNNLTVGAMAAFTYLTAELDPVGTAPNSQSVTGKGTHDTLIITPALVITYKM